MSKYDSKFVGASAAPVGWTKVGNIAVNSSNNQNYPFGFIPGILDTYDTTAYVIVSDTTTANLVGRTTGGGLGVALPDQPTWWVTPAKSDISFIDLAKRLTGSYSLSTAVESKTLLNSLGYWTSYGLTPPPPSSVIPLDHIVYYTLRDDLSLQAYSPYPLNYGDDITDFYRYPYYNTAFSATLSATGISNFFGGYTQGYATFSQFNSVDMAYTPGTYSYGSDIALVSYEDPSTNISFIHGSGGSYSIYFVGRPEATSDSLFQTRFTIFTTQDSSSPGAGKWERLYVSSLGASQGNTFSVVFESNQNSGMSNQTINKVEFEVGLTASSFDNQPLRIFSILGQNVGNTTSTAIWAYVNEVLVATQSHIKVPNSNAASETILQLMSESGGFEKSRFYKGYFAELLIYDYMHDSTSHSDIINEMKTRWGI